jgi:hypothetical protein
MQVGILVGLVEQEPLHLSVSPSLSISPSPPSFHSLYPPPPPPSLQYLHAQVGILVGLVEDEFAAKVHLEEGAVAAIPYEHLSKLA